MSGYVKKIAVVRQIKNGFSADGGAVSGLVKAESYAGFLKAEVSLINLAPLSEGRYVFGLCDGLNTVVFEGSVFEGETPFSLADGFAFLACFYKDGLSPFASASCGQMACALPDLKEEMARREKSRKVKGGAAYDDDAIAAENYYEHDQADNGEGAVRPTEEEQKEGDGACENEENTRSVQGEKEERIAYPSPLAGGEYYAKIRGEAERIFLTYPRESELELAVEGSRFARISYGEGRFYVFGVVYKQGVPAYVCYGVPAFGKREPPPTLKDCSTYLSTGSGGYFISWQDAATGARVKALSL